MKPNPCFAFCAAAFTLQLAGCGNPANTTVPAASISSTGNPQVAAYMLTLPLPGAVTVAFGQSTTYGLHTSSQHFAGGQPITIYVAGMLPSTTFHLQGTIAYDNGSVATEPDLVFTTGAIPAGLIPNFTVATTNGLTPQPGIELVDNLEGTAPSIPFATDLAGNVIWTYLFPDRQAASVVYPIKLQTNGHFLSLIAPQSQTILTVGPATSSTLNVLREIDLAGNIVRQLTMTDLNSSLAAAGYALTLQVFSHDFAVLPNGHILVIANTLKPFTDLPWTSRYHERAWGCCRGSGCELQASLAVERVRPLRHKSAAHGFPRLDPLQCDYLFPG